MVAPTLVPVKRAGKKPTTARLAKLSFETCEAPILVVSLPPETATETSALLLWTATAGVATIASDLAFVAHPVSCSVAATRLAAATIRTLCFI